MISKMRRCSSSTSMDNGVCESEMEIELRKRSVITPEDVLRLNRITDGLFIYLFLFFLLYNRWLNCNIK